MSKMKIAIAGANGRMGHMLIEAVLKADDAVLTGALDVPDSPNLGNDAGMFLICYILSGTLFQTTICFIQ